MTETSSTFDTVVAIAGLVFGIVFAFLIMRMQLGLLMQMKEFYELRKLLRVYFQENHGLSIEPSDNGRGPDFWAFGYSQLPDGVNTAKIYSMTDRRCTIIENEIRLEDKPKGTPRKKKQERMELQQTWQPT